jgi:23S rRNA (guanosine2251-2'-O)-methyltransferase
MSQLIYGKNPVKQMLIDHRDIKQILLAVDDREIESMAMRNHIKVKKTDKRYLTSLTGVDTHQGVAAEIPDYRTYELEDLMNSVQPGKHGLIILLDELEDPHNLGAVLRTADAVGAEGVIFKKTHSVGLTPTVAKVSAGAIDTVKCCCVTNLSRVVETLQKNGWWTVGTDMDGQDSRSLKYDFNCVLVIGNEGKGISRLVREKCDYVVSLPMVGKIESLNASVSAGILMYQIFSARNPLQ